MKYNIKKGHILGMEQVFLHLFFILDVDFQERLSFWVILSFFR